MNGSRFKSDQELNAWVEMLFNLYGATQNYSKTPFEVYTHLAEVCGVFGKHLFKKKDLMAARSFLPKIFAWSVALLKAMRPTEQDLEAVILRKFPGVCPYCLEAPCKCWKGEKPTLNFKELRNKFFKEGNSIRRTLNDFQFMFKKIYSETWVPVGLQGTPLNESLQIPFNRLIEELSEIAESIRFAHLYPQNFENELADFIAWWFALVSSFSIDGELLLTEEMMWRAYPGRCPYCGLMPCFCRPGPVRELMSKPPPGENHRFDVLTSVYNQAAYEEDLEAVQQGELTVVLPLACVRIDLDNFKSVNDTYGHIAGDAALRHVAAILRSKVSERDRVYRISGDEFGVLFMDRTGVEGVGALRRVLAALKEHPVHYVGKGHKGVDFHVSISVGVCECISKDYIRNCFEIADEAAYKSKENGKATVTLGDFTPNAISAKE